MNDPEDKQRKYPEFIILDDGQTKYEMPPRGSKFPQYEDPPVKEPSWKIRLLFFFVACTALLWTVGAALLTAVLGLLSLLTFLQVPFLKKLTLVYWSWVRGGTIVTLGCTVSLFNFSLGLIIMLYYFSQVKESWQKSMFDRFVTPHMQEP